PGKLTGAYRVLLRRERVGARSYSLRVPSAGVYRVSLVMPANKPGAKSSRVTAEGRAALSALKPNARRAQVASFTTAVADGRLNLGFTGAALAFSGIQVGRVAALTPGAYVPIAA